MKLFLMNTLGKLAFSSRTTLLSICEQKDTSSKERSLQDSSNFLKDAGLTILVPINEKKKERRETISSRLKSLKKQIIDCDAEGE